MSPKSIINAALNLLGNKFKSADARRILLAIGYQESAFKYRRQIKGPARGFWQFERAGGVMGVLTHKATKDKAAKLLEKFGFGKLYDSKARLLSSRVHDSFEREKFDILAAGFARLLLWSDPNPIPSTMKEAWEYYLRNWRPGKPHPERWEESWQFAQEELEEIEAKETK